MSSAILQSNSQSALISTLNSTSSASIDPFIYSLNKRVPAHGCQWTQLHPTNSGAKTPGKTMNFDLTKSGFTRTLVLDIKLKMGAFNGAVGAVVPPGWCLGTRGGGFLNLIDNITIESSSRRLGTMTKASIIAAMSDLAPGPRLAMQRAWGCEYDPSNGQVSPSDEAHGWVHAQIPLLFSYFGACDLSLSTGFVEPCRVCVTWAKDFDNSVAAAVSTSPEYGQKTGDAWTAVKHLGAAFPLDKVKDITQPTAAGVYPDPANPIFAMAIEIDEATLIVDNRLLPSPMTDATLQANYGSGPLTELVYNYSEQPSKQAKLGVASGRGGVL